MIYCIQDCIGIWPLLYGFESPQSHVRTKFHVLNSCAFDPRLIRRGSSLEHRRKLPNPLPGWNSLPRRLPLLLLRLNPRSKLKPPQSSPARILYLVASPLPPSLLPRSRSIGKSADKSDSPNLENDGNKRLKKTGRQRRLRRKGSG